MPNFVPGNNSWTAQAIIWAKECLIISILLTLSFYHKKPLYPGMVFLRFSSIFPLLFQHFLIRNLAIVYNFLYFFADYFWGSFTIVNSAGEKDNFIFLENGWVSLNNTGKSNNLYFIGQIFQV